jgi:hypothetical protein
MRKKFPVHSFEEKVPFGEHCCCEDVEANASSLIPMSQALPNGGGSNLEFQSGMPADMAAWD